MMGAARYIGAKRSSQVEGHRLPELYFCDESDPVFRNVYVPLSLGCRIVVFDYNSSSRHAVDSKMRAVYAEDHSPVFDRHYPYADFVGRHSLHRIRESGHTHLSFGRVMSGI